MAKEAELGDELDVPISLPMRLSCLNNLSRKIENINVYVCHFGFG